MSLIIFKLETQSKRKTYPLKLNHEHSSQYATYGQIDLSLFPKLSAFLKEKGREILLTFYPMRAARSLAGDRGFS